MNEEKFKCKRCKTPISSHNQYRHDGMCDDCFFKEHLPEDAQIYETEIDGIKRIMKIQEKDNMTFWKWLKTDELDFKRFNNLVKEVTEKIDCNQCRNCCRVLTANLNGADISRISEHLGLTKEEFTSKYLIKNEENEFELRQKPCPFLEENKCKIFEVRPEACKEYPHLDKVVSYRCHQFFSNAEICPIVFNVLQNAKKEFLGGHMSMKTWMFKGR